MSGDILFLAHRVPYPPDRGDKIRSWHLLRAMCKFARVHLVALCDDARDLEHLDFLRSVAASVHVEMRNTSKTRAMAAALLSHQPASVCAFASQALQAHVNELLASQPISTIFAYSGQMAQFVPNDMGGRRFVMDFVDMDSEKFATYAAQASGPAAWANAFEAKRLRAFEIATAKRATLSLFVSDAEAALFRQHSALGYDRVSHIENGIDLAAYDPSKTYTPVCEGEGPLLVFTGQMDYRPNVDAVTEFARAALPLIRDRFPKARFAIVGRNPTSDVQALAALPGVIVTGEVPDTRAWLASADIVVAPLVLARGIQNKVLEAMAMAKTVVASPQAALGIDASIGTEIIVAEGSAAQASEICDLLTSPARLRTIGDAARHRIEARYGWDARLSGLASMLRMPALMVEKAA